MKVTPTRQFLRDLKRLSPEAREAVIAAVELFVRAPQTRSLNFERVRSREPYRTIRANLSLRVLLRETGKNEFEAVCTGNHDYIYRSFFR